MALCQSKGDEASCPQCRHPLSAGSLFAPLVLPTKEELERQAKEKEQREAAEAEEAKKRAEAGEDDEKMGAAAAAAAPIKRPAKKRARLNNGDEERKGDDDDEDDYDANGADADGDDAAAAAVDPNAEVDPESLSGTVEFDAKLTALIDEIRRMKQADPTAKALVFTQFRGTMDKIDQRMKDEGIKHEMVRPTATIDLLVPPRRVRMLTFS
jgi:SNF2 family DNA or RNA helicase